MKRLKEYALGFALLIVAGGAYFGYRQFFGKKVGESCAEASECAGNLPWGGNSCLYDSGNYYCANPCDTDGDCQPGWQCGQVSKTYKGMTTNQVDSYCVKP